MPNINQYLKRIQTDQVEPPSLNYLARLQWNHMLTVPFENLDIVWGRPIFLDRSRFYDKIVNQGRGGFCYELNGLFAWLLEQLGFQVTMMAGGVYDERFKGFGPVHDHMCLLVQLDHPYLVDVGYGDSTRKPISLPKGESNDVSGRYRVRPDAIPDTYILQKFVDGIWQPQYQFSTLPRKLTEYQQRCDYFQTALDSYFTQGSICTRATESGRISLTDNTLTLTQNGIKEKILLNSTDEFDEILWRRFWIRKNNINSHI